MSVRLNFKRSGGTIGKCCDKCTNVLRNFGLYCLNDPRIEVQSDDICDFFVPILTIDQQSPLLQELKKNKIKDGLLLERMYQYYVAKINKKEMGFINVIKEEVKRSIEAAIDSRQEEIEQLRLIMDKFNNEA